MKHPAELDTGLANDGQWLEGFQALVVALTDRIVDFRRNCTGLAGIEHANMAIPVNREPGRVHAMRSRKVSVGWEWRIEYERLVTRFVSARKGMGQKRGGPLPGSGGLCTPEATKPITLRGEGKAPPPNST